MAFVFWRDMPPCECAPFARLCACSPARPGPPRRPFTMDSALELRVGSAFCLVALVLSRAIYQRNSRQEGYKLHPRGSACKRRSTVWPCFNFTHLLPGVMQTRPLGDALAVDERRCTVWSCLYLTHTQFLSLNTIAISGKSSFRCETLVGESFVGSTPSSATPSSPSGLVSPSAPRCASPRAKRFSSTMGMIMTCVSCRRRRHGCGACGFFLRS